MLQVSDRYTLRCAVRVLVCNLVEVTEVKDELKELREERGDIFDEKARTTRYNQALAEEHFLKVVDAFRSRSLTQNNVTKTGLLLVLEERCMEDEEFKTMSNLFAKIRKHSLNTFLRNSERHLSSCVAKINLDRTNNHNELYSYFQLKESQSTKQSCDEVNDSENLFEIFRVKFTCMQFHDIFSHIYLDYETLPRKSLRTDLYGAAVAAQRIDEERILKNFAETPASSHSEGSFGKLMKHSEVLSDLQVSLKRDSEQGKQFKISKSHLTLIGELYILVALLLFRCITFVNSVLLKRCYSGRFSSENTSLRGSTAEKIGCVRAFLYEEENTEKNYAPPRNCKDETIRF